VFINVGCVNASTIPVSKKEPILVSISNQSSQKELSLDYISETLENYKLKNYKSILLI
jgi:hypothetical protein